MTPAMPAPERIIWYLLSKEAIANLSELNQATTQNGDCIVLIFKRFKERLRRIPIVLSDLPLPVALTENATGVAVLTATGTEAEIAETDPELVRQVRARLHRELARYELLPGELSGYEDAVAL